MTLSQFKLLDKDKRYIIWLAKSIELSSYEENGDRHVLYQLDNFYIEIQFMKLCPEIVTFIAFTDTSLLDRYLQDIDISFCYCK